ncbi:WXG100 family type VII secretion target [Microbacterium sp. Marseille-Q6965]|uniref:WXG100 family type VII secretion target n=1 Tax=Microbacterium sp. Marseille-Q6965 TaxID=2965072 RepID=UPI0021B75A90|nr:WXG100 family type VII secretion target [Microbacterium sp. Marseille-Q6965]
MRLKVDTEELRSAAAALQDAAKAVTANADGVRQGVGQLQTGWTGVAQHSFSAAHTDVDVRWRRKAAILDDAAARLRRAAGDYESADAAGARAVLGL